MSVIDISNDFPISPRQYAEMFFDRQYSVALGQAAGVDVRIDQGCWIHCTHRPADAGAIEAGDASQNNTVESQHRHAMHDGDTFERHVYFDVHSKVPHKLPAAVQGLRYDEAFTYKVGSNVAAWSITPETNGGLGKHVKAQGFVYFEPSRIYQNGVCRHVVGTVEMHDLPWYIKPFQPLIESLARSQVADAYKKATQFTIDWMLNNPPPPEPAGQDGSVQQGVAPAAVAAPVQDPTPL